ncbi:RIIa domain-containing protein 1-like isoform X2 [Dendronephthya gigantea]|uniref:RIIa domain-containing protein 1-like isoform X2 n=1 Tax=Dendronephthya gigantea TaxID=151771 RepID=UPI00106B3909|nr:RIIa domain-containing protein 1-like isoform X2 [Dendronephthya gigantea]
MATQLNISGLGENDDGALTVEQQTKLNHFKIETRLANEKYLRSHAEISHVTQAFIKEVLKKRPENDISLIKNLKRKYKRKTQRIF